MKTLIMSLVAATTIVSASAFAVLIPGWERPISQSTMVIRSQAGTLAHVASPLEVTLTRQDGQTQLTGITVKFAGTEHAIPFKITRAYGLNGAVTYVAVRVFPDKVISESSMTVYLTSTNGFWSLRLAQFTMGAATGDLSAEGISHPVITIQ